MAKRFTDTQKWKRPWFRSLSKEAKLVWQYLCDECDHAGVWIADFDLLTFQVGFKVDEPKLVEWLGDKLVRVSSDKFFIPSFFEFQYGQSDSMFRAKQGALRELAKYGVLNESGESLKDLTNSYLTLIELQGIGKGTGTGNSEKESEEKPKVSAADLEAVYQLYPRKEGKSDGLRIARTQIKTPKDLADLKTAVERYKEKIKRDGTEAKFIKHFGSFMGRWRDFLDANYGQADTTKTDDSWMKELFTGPDGAA